MKTYLLTGILFFGAANIAISQITITSSDMPKGGDTTRLSTTTDTAGLPPPALTGAGITWDYSRLIPASQTIDTFLSASSTPITYQFFFNDAILYPAYASTVAQGGNIFLTYAGINVTNVIDYYKDETANYESVGLGATVNSIPAPIQDDTIDVVYEFPMNYGNADSCHSSFHMSLSSFGYFGEWQYRVNHVEGWGTLITPFGTFQALKVKTLLYTTDSAYDDTLHYGFLDPQFEQIQYKWLANGQPVPLLQINEVAVNNTPTYENTVYRDSARNVSTGITNINSPLKNVVLYPNPAVENTTLTYSLAASSAVNMAVYSVDGRCVSRLYAGEQRAGNRTLTMSVLNFEPGIYLLKIDANGEQTVKKLAVVQ